MPDYGYIINWVKDVHVMDDGYLIVLGGVAQGDSDPIINTRVIKTDFNGTVLWNQVLIDGGYGYACNWDEIFPDEAVRANSFEISG